MRYLTLVTLSGLAALVSPWFVFGAVGMLAYCVAAPAIEAAADEE